MGQLEAFEQIGDRSYLATISFAVESAGAELTQLLNLMWGTGSFFPGFRVDRLELPPSLLAQYRGPRFGVAGCGSESRSTVGRCSAPPSSRWG